MMKLNYIIIGAGISGLTTAKKINELGIGKVLVLEKSRGVGGRMATRRTLETRFDHGAQFYRLKNDILGLHQSWLKKALTHQWFVSSNGEHWCAKAGMTSFAKYLVEDIDITLETEIISIQFENNLWKLISKKNEEWYCQNLIITSPLPQTIKLLELLSLKKILNLNVFQELKEINYTKAVIALVTLDEDLIFDESGYQEFADGNYFSISDQKKKGISEIPAITITMSPTYSNSNFEHPDESILNNILTLFKADYPKAKIKNAELKKWRYCQPLSHFKEKFSEISPNLYLIGDAFGGSSLLGAVRSSEALTQFLQEKK